MFEHLLQLTILFLVIFDPLASFAVFYVTTAHLTKSERNKIALLAVLVAATISYAVLFFGQDLLHVFNTTIEDFRVASGVILGILGIKMALGQSLSNLDAIKDNSAFGIAAIIGTPLLTGPAAITSIIVNVNDYGIVATGTAITIVLSLTAIFFYQSFRIHRLIGTTPIQVISTFLGLITVAWGVKFIREGLGF